jgi:uncharacterized protein YndB with AHSA1/START domain
MNDQAVERATGRSLAQWFDAITRAGKEEAPHKEIADLLHDRHGVSAWWAQEITVEYERRAGRRVLGQTQDGLFQVGVNKTIDAPAAQVWGFLQSPAGLALLAADPEGPVGSSPVGGGERRGPSLPSGLRTLEALDGSSPSGVHLRTTTFEAGSHVRLQWQRRRWARRAILQVRVTPKTEAKTLLSFHQEKLPSEEDRREMREHWRRVAREIAASLKAGG